MKKKFLNLASRPFFAPLSLALIAAALFLEFLFRQESYLPVAKESELLNQWYPYLTFWTAQLKSGEFPMWSHNLMAGFPLYCFPHAGFFYPPFLLFLAMGFSRAFTLSALLHIICRMVLTYGLLRECSRSRFASWLTAAAFGLSGSSIIGPQYLQGFDTLTWMPGVLWFAIRLGRHARFHDFLALAGLTALGYLGGDLEILLYSLILFLAFIWFVEKAALTRLAIVALAPAAGVLICAAPFLATLSYLAQSSRGTAGSSPAATSWEQIGVFMPLLVRFRPNSGEPILSYFGFLLPLGFFALWHDRQSRPLLRFTLIAILISMIYLVNVQPFSLLFNVLPVLHYSAAEMRSRLIYPLMVLFMVAASGGFDLLMRGVDIKSLRPARAFAALFIIFEAAWIALGIITQKKLSPLGASLAILLIFLLGLYALKKLRGHNRGVIRISSSALIAVLVLDLLSFAILAMPRTPPSVLGRPEVDPALTRAKPTERLHLLSLFLDLDSGLWRFYRLDQGPGFVFGHIRNGLLRYDRLLDVLAPDYHITSNYKTIRVETQPLLDFLAVKYVVSNMAPIMLMDDLPLDLPFLPSQYQSHGHYLGERPPLTGRGYAMGPGSEWTVSTMLLPGDELDMTVAPALSSRCVRIRLTSPAKERQASRLAAELTPDPEWATPAPLAVESPEEYELSLRTSAGCPQDLEFIAPRIRNPRRPYQLMRTSYGQLYRNRDALDHYGLYTGVAKVEDRDGPAYLFDPARFEPRTRLALDPASLDPRIPPDQPARTRVPDEVKVMEYLDNRVVLTAQAPAPCYLSIAESYYPGWRAWVDGKETRIIRANYAFQAVALPGAGPHRITLRFAPAEFRIGLWVSLASIMAALLAASPRAADRKMGRAKAADAAAGPDPRPANR
ncbi:MAG TPA: YfhO family protein [bacterium]|nr:YfhO family protein [bacterium]